MHGNAWDRGTQQRFRCNCMALCDVYALCVAHTHTHTGSDICTSSRTAINCVPVRVSVAVHDATRSAARRFTTQSVFHFMRARAPRGTYFCNLKCPHAMSRACALAHGTARAACSVLHERTNIGQKLCPHACARDLRAFAASRQRNSAIRSERAFIASARRACACAYTRTKCAYLRD